MESTENVFDANAARGLVEKFEQDKANHVQKKEEEHQKQMQSLLQEARRLLEKEWIPAIREIAQKGSRQIVVDAPNESVGRFGCEVLQERGFKAVYSLKEYPSSADDGKRPDQPTITIEW